MNRIDTHQHFVPPAFKQAMIDAGISHAGGRETPDWSAQAAIDFMDTHGIGGAVLSISTPGVHFGNDAAARTLARKLNVAGAELATAHPGRFGFFAILTLPDVDGAIAELHYAFDELGADGIVLLANTKGVYLGDPAFDALFDELERRHAVVFVHPGALPGPDVPGVVPFAADFLLDTTRAAMKLVVSGTMERCPNIKVILSHGGGLLPYASYRIAPLVTPTWSTPQGLIALKRFHFDLALSSSPAALPSLLAFADPQKITYGSDFPYAPVETAAAMIDWLEDYPLDTAQRVALDRGNAALLFPRFAPR